MKVYLLILSLALFQIVSSQAPANWTDVNSDELDGDNAMQDALTFGVGQVIEIAVQAGSFPNSDYDVTGIFSVLKQVATDGMNYRFEVQVTSIEAEVRRVKCDVHAPTTGDQDVPRYFYGSPDSATWTITVLGEFTFLPKGVFHKNPALDWTEVTSDALNSNTSIQNALTFGVNYVIKIAVNASNFADSDYDVTGIYSVLKQIASDGMNYRFEVQVTSAEAVVRRVKCDVHTPAAGNNQTVPRYYYGALDSVAWTITELGAFTFLPEGVYHRRA